MSAKTKKGKEGLGFNILAESKISHKTVMSEKVRKKGGEKREREKGLKHNRNSAVAGRGRGPNSLNPPAFCRDSGNGKEKK